MSDWPNVKCLVIFWAFEMQMNVIFGVDYIILTVKLIQEARIHSYMLFVQEWLMCSRHTLTNENSVRKILTRILFLPLNNLGSTVLCLCISVRESQGWVFHLRVCTLYFLSHLRTKSNKKVAAIAISLEGFEEAQWPGHQNALLEPTQLHKHLSVLEWWPFICL